ncbi:MAG: response regulator [Desulfuromonadales bacterium]|nr:response regulator [Desulfuromonadales bacterium]
MTDSNAMLPFTHERDVMAQLQFHNILVLDDEENSRVVLCKLLQNEGYNVSSAGNGDEALDMLHTTNYQLVISDVNMPGMNGLDFLKRAQKLRPEIKIIMVTAYGDISSYLEAMNFGASEYLNKPVRIKELTSVMHKLTHCSTAPSGGDTREA